MTSAGKSSAWVRVLRDQIETLRRLRDNAWERDSNDRASELDAMLAEYEAYLESYLRDHPEHR